MVVCKQIIRYCVAIVAIISFLKFDESQGTQIEPQILLNDQEMYQRVTQQIGQDRINQLKAQQQTQINAIIQKNLDHAVPQTSQQMTSMIDNSGKDIFLQYLMGISAQQLTQTVESTLESQFILQARSFINIQGDVDGCARLLFQNTIKNELHEIILTQVNQAVQSEEFQGVISNQLDKLMRHQCHIESMMTQSRIIRHEAQYLIQTPYDLISLPIAKVPTDAELNSDDFHLASMKSYIKKYIGLGGKVTLARILPPFWMLLWACKNSGWEWASWLSSTFTIPYIEHQIHPFNSLQTFIAGARLVSRNANWVATICNFLENSSKNDDIHAVYLEDRIHCPFVTEVYQMVNNKFTSIAEAKAEYQKICSSLVRWSIPQKLLKLSWIGTSTAFYTFMATTAWTPDSFKEWPAWASFIPAALGLTTEALNGLEYLICKKIKQLETQRDMAVIKILSEGEQLPTQPWYKRIFGWAYKGLKNWFCCGKCIDSGYRRKVIAADNIVLDEVQVVYDDPLNIEMQESAVINDADTVTK